jgi:hypothetical protein
MVFKVTVDVAGLVEDPAPEAVVRKSAFAQINGGPQAHTKVCGEGFIASQVTAGAYWKYNAFHYP